MKKLILSTALFFLAVSVFAGNQKYEQKMKQLLGKMQTCQTVEDFQNLANQFETVAKAEKKEWLPAYYQAQCLITTTFMDREASEAEKDEVLDVVETLVEKILKKEPKNAEVHVMHAFYLTARLSVNPMVRGQEYSMRSQQAVGQALGMDSDNPRARYMKLANDIGTARFFGGDTQQFCGQAQELLGGWDNFKAKSEIHPNWGKDQVEEIISTCK